MYRLKKRITQPLGCFLCIILLTGVSACSNDITSTTTETIPENSAEEILDVSPSELYRKIPDTYKGSSGVFQLSNDALDTDTDVNLYSAKLKCSDGVERQSWSLEKNAIYLSNDKDKTSTDGIVSSSDNITLMSYVAAREDTTVGDIMDAVTAQEAEKAANGTLMVSDTVECKTNVFLTDFITSSEKIQTETFYILQIMDKKTVQIYSISRTYDKSALSIDTAEADTADLVKYFLASDDNRDVFCGVIQAILKKI